MQFPFFQDWEGINDKKMKYNDRRMRIFMRGVKIGIKRGGGAEIGMSLFEMKDKKKQDATVAQKVSEDVFKSSLSDESLGLTSDKE